VTMDKAPTRLLSSHMRMTVLLVGTLGGVYGISQFLRNSIGVIAPDLAGELSLSATDIGLLSSVFFFSFAAAQIPLGIALDRYGPRNCMLVCAAIAMAGALIFAVADSLAALMAARMLMGLGSSCYLMAPLALYAKRFPPDRFATMAGIQVGLGTLGTLLATAPYAFVVALVGWRACFVGIAAVMLFAGILIAVVVREARPESPHPRQTFKGSFAGTLAAARTRSFWPVFAMQFSAYSSFVAVVGLWGGPYLTHIYGYSLTERGNMLLVAVAGHILGAFLWGPSDRLFNSYRIPVLIGALLTAATMGLAALIGVFPQSLLVLWFLAVGVTTGSLPVLIAHGKSLFDPQILGRGLTLLNIATMGGVFVAQSVTGFLIDLFPAAGSGYALSAYRAVFAFQAGVILLGSLIYLWAEDPRRNPRVWG
jgi:predicted MFS family arabinose efflux permease